MYINNPDAEISEFLNHANDYLNVLTVYRVLLDISSGVSIQGYPLTDRGSKMAMNIKLHIDFVQSK